jgi:hypothetical protein
MRMDSSPSQPGYATQRITHRQRAALCCSGRHCVADAATGCNNLRSVATDGTVLQPVALLVCCSGSHCVAIAATGCNGLWSVATDGTALQPVALLCNRFGCATPGCAALQQVAASWYGALLQHACAVATDGQKLLVASSHNHAAATHAGSPGPSRRSDRAAAPLRFAGAARGVPRGRLLHAARARATCPVACCGLRSAAELRRERRSAAALAAALAAVNGSGKCRAHPTQRRVRARGCAGVRVCAGVRACECACVRVCVCAYVCVCGRAGACVSVGVWACVCVFVGVSVCARVPVHSRVCVRVRVCVRACVRACTQCWAGGPLMRRMHFFRPTPQSRAAPCDV